MTHMTLKYDISQIGRSWCLNDRLDLSNQTHPSDFYMCTQTGTAAGFICTAVKLFQAQCVHHEYQRKCCSMLN